MKHNWLESHVRLCPPTLTLQGRTRFRRPQAPKETSRQLDSRQRKALRPERGLKVISPHLSNASWRIITPESIFYWRPPSGRPRAPKAGWDPLEPRSVNTPMAGEPGHVGSMPPHYLTAACSIRNTSAEGRGHLRQGGIAAQWLLATASTAGGAEACRGYGPRWTQGRLLIGEATHHQEPLCGHGPHVTVGPQRLGLPGFVPLVR
ncbi:hypothetical protein DB88DRAFT_253320 [Papiliotrema laurentii]|uniref:Uncharacterized protein n=1 Tax=Papiliotrema laurentii TaxID=5418 RepID=A0AAD9FRZ5_PAPLA|nr:hypothetical protein DB88DRAFT_253320 [Papiliotrema laurentii]